MDSATGKYTGPFLPNDEKLLAPDEVLKMIRHLPEDEQIPMSSHILALTRMVLRGKS